MAIELAGLDDLAATVRPDIGRRGRPPKALASAPAALPGGWKALAAASAAPPDAQIPATTSSEAAEEVDVAEARPADEAEGE